MKQATEIHPVWDIEIPEVKTLIVGSYLPRKEVRNFDFFYPNFKNRMWPTLARIAGVPLHMNLSQNELRDERVAILQALKVGMVNMGQKIERLKASSLDKDIRIKEYHDILGLLSAKPEVKKILLSGYSGASSAFETFKRYLREEGLHCDWPKNKEKRALVCFKLNLADREITCVLMNSTSPASRKAGVTDDLLFEQFRQEILS